MTTPPWLHNISVEDDEEDEVTTTEPMVVIALSPRAARLAGGVAVLGILSMFYTAVKFVVNH